ncbi:hypothetical protein C2G38_2311147 [Gigaspora rosea]|uniref:Uncharacterized protein n=1 Tax=Gigaspora rosea TaxID=44941 RepID=A0A397VFQ5_9GLOM|nr:hypothetical protein C2G38_2311147 [Gigaspora rosea]
MSSKPEAKDLSCFFAFFAKKHPNSDLLKHVEKCREGKWRNASATAAKTRITEMAEYFPELTSYLDSMESYSLCGGHYNRVIAKKAFINQLKKETDSILSSGEPEKKRLKFSNDDDKLKVSEKTFVDFGAQVDLFEKTFVDFGAQVDLCEKTCADFGSYVSFSDPMCEILQRRIDELEKNNKPLLSENEALKKKLSERFTNQQDRINSIIEIAQKERSNLYEDITNLMKNQERFCLDNLLKYSPSKWLAERNLVVVKFIETLTHNEGEHQHREEKLFKHAVAIDAIYGSRHLKYVSAINLATSAIKYSLARSKMIVDIDNHIISSGSYTKFNSWLESLAGEQLQLPEGFRFWLLTMNRKSVNPWLYTELDQKQYEELFHLSSGELCVEKNQETNAIDELVHHQSQIGHMKKCTVCQTSNIDNKKRVCPECHNKLPTIAEIIDEQHKIINAAEKSTVISPYVFKQRSVPESEVHTPQIFFPDPIGINPNSIDNVRKVLEHIKEISGVKDDSRKWVVVTCDGVPYHHIQKMKKDFPWLILIPGALHEEMNMLKAFVELNWNIDIRDFAKCQGYRTENQLQFFKKCSDHHKSWDSICNIYMHAMVSELMLPYVISEENPSVEGYLKWAQNQTDHMFRLKYEQVFIYLQAIINFRTCVRFNRPLLRFAARRIFAPIWSARRHPIYRLIEVTDEEQMLRLKPEIRNLIQERIVTSRSKLSNQHQGHDAILEEINKSLKSLIPPIPSQRHWEIAARNCTKFSKLRTNIFNIIGYSESEVNEPRTRPGGELTLSEEMIRFSEIARMKRIEFIKAKLIEKTPLGIWRPIPVTCEEAELQKSESSLKKSQILSIINSLTPSLGDLDRSRFRGLSNKSREDLVDILQEIRNILAGNSIDANEV